MRVGITGSEGQLGRALQDELRDHPLYLIDLPDQDITDLDEIVASLACFRPDIIIHAAAYTDVDGCERNPDLAYRVNALGTRNVALACQSAGCPMVYVSTDYVFDGTKNSPYWEYDDTAPLSVYAASKLAGERIVQALLQRFYIVRTAWLYSRTGNNFLKTVLRLTEERDSLHVVTDEIGSPTYAPHLARAITKLVRRPAYGIYHFTNRGTCSRYEWARRALALAGKPDYLLHPSTNYPREARVPSCVELKNFFGAELGIVLRPWDEALGEYFE